jgi:hypothetical protein
MNDPFQCNFGTWSAKDAGRCAALLKTLGVRFKIYESEETQEVLEAWHAWDPSSPMPHVGHLIWVHEEDFGKVGDNIVNMFPERKFEDA